MSRSRPIAVHRCLMNGHESTGQHVPKEVEVSPGVIGPLPCSDGEVLEVAP